MPFNMITRDSLEILNQNYRLPGVMPRPVPPGRGAAINPQDPSFTVADEFIRVIPFVSATMSGRRPYARQYQVLTQNPLAEPEFTARGAASPWVTGETFPAGEELEISGSRFKKISTEVRTDELMVGELSDAWADDQDSDDIFKVQVGLARTAIIRALSEAILFSNPVTDDDDVLAGVPFYLPAGSPNDVTYDSARGMIGGLSELEARTTPSDGDFGARADVFVVSERARWRLLKELEDKGVTPDFMHCPWTGRVQFHFHGLPVLGGRVPEPTDGTTEAWAMKLVGPTGVRVLHVGGEMDDFGLRHETINTVVGLDGNGEAQSATRGVEVFGIYAINVPEPNAIARLSGIPIADPFTTP
jgi:hypothetical protein